MNNFARCFSGIIGPKRNHVERVESSAQMLECPEHHRNGYIKIILCAVIFLAAVVTYILLVNNGGLNIFSDKSALQDKIISYGLFGPLALMILMVGAIVFSPIPSAPIALTAGAIFGHTWGTIYVLIGAEAGAVLAFFISRKLGYDIVHKWIGEKSSVALLGSQNKLTVIVFVSRLIPFISFDVISYAAGLTSLSFLRFAFATLAGIIPASFLLAHFGSEAFAAEAESGLITVVLLGGITLIPVAIRLIQKYYFKFRRSI